MKDDLKKQIRANLDFWDSNNLLKIWSANDRFEWSEEAFEVIREILEERLGTVPPQDELQETNEIETDLENIHAEGKIEAEDPTTLIETMVIEVPQIRGLPGYRTRNGRTGYDPLDSQAEAARMEGLLIKYLFTFKLRTRDPYHLILMVIFGAIPFLLLSFLTVNELIFSSPPNWFVLTVTPQYIILTGALSINLILCLLKKDEIHNNHP